MADVFNFIWIFWSIVIYRISSQRLNFTIVNSLFILKHMKHDLKISLLNFVSPLYSMFSKFFFFWVGGRWKRKEVKYLGWLFPRKTGIIGDFQSKFPTFGLMFLIWIRGRIAVLGFYKGERNLYPLFGIQKSSGFAKK